MSTEIIVLRLKLVSKYYPNFKSYHILRLIDMSFCTVSCIYMLDWQPNLCSRIASRGYVNSLLRGLGIFSFMRGKINWCGKRLNGSSLLWLFSSSKFYLYIFNIFVLPFPFSTKWLRDMITRPSNIIKSQLYNYKINMDKPPKESSTTADWLLAPPLILFTFKFTLVPPTARVTNL